MAANIATGRGFVNAICDALGITDPHVVAVRIEADVRDIAMVYIQRSSQTGRVRR